MKDEHQNGQKSRISTLHYQIQNTDFSKNIKTSNHVDEVVNPKICIKLHVLIGTKDHNYIFVLSDVKVDLVKF